MLLACNSEHSQHTSKVSETTSHGVSEQRHWEISQRTDKRLFLVKLNCKKKLHVGGFQQCSVTLNRRGEKISGATISIDGGMKAHGHGLPTAPEVVATDIPGQYEIEGLKFSMPGDWILGFRVLFDGAVDQTIFKLSL